MGITFFLIFSFISLTVFASGTTKVFAVCNANDPVYISPSEFVNSIVRSGLKETKLGKNVSCSGGNVTMLGPREDFETSIFFSIEFANKDLYNYIKNQDNDFKTGKTSMLPPKNLADVFFRFHLESGGACDILVPSNSISRTKDKPAPARSAIKTKTQSKVK